MMLKSMSPWARVTFRIRQRLLDVLVALSLAFLVWLYTRSRDQEVLDRVPIPVQIQLAKPYAGNYDLEVNGHSRVAVSFSGPPSRVRELRRRLQRGLVQIAVNLTVPEERQNDASYRDSVRIDVDDIPVPPGVAAVVAEESTTIPYTVRRLVERILPVRLDYAGETRISQIKVEPATVTVRGPKDILDRIWSISTMPYALSQTPDASATNNSIRGEVSLVSELEGRPLQTTPRSVSFNFRIRPRQKTFEVTGVPVRFLCPPNYPFRARFAPDHPGKVNLRLQGPAGEEAPPVTAFVDLTSGTFGKGRNLEPVRLQLPKEFALAQETPPLVSFILEPIERPASASHDADE
jgi:YbbR domain-containing protein